MIHLVDFEWKKHCDDLVKESAELILLYLQYLQDGDNNSIEGKKGIYHLILRLNTILVPNIFHIRNKTMVISKAICQMKLSFDWKSREKGVINMEYLCHAKHIA
jgi:hypothetical protein